MEFLDYACKKVNELYKSYGWAGISRAYQTSEGYAFVADYGPKYDGRRVVYEDPYIFAFEKDSRFTCIAYGSKRWHALMDNAVLIELQDEYLSERKRKNTKR